MKMHKKKTKKKESNPTISLYRYDKLINEIFKRIKSDKNIYTKAWTELYRLNNLVETISKWDQTLIKDIEEKNKMIKRFQELHITLVDKYEDRLEEYEKANKTLAEQNEDLKARLFGRFTYKMKTFVKNEKAKDKKKKEDLN